MAVATEERRKTTSYEQQLIWQEVPVARMYREHAKERRRYGALGRGMG